MTSLLGFASFCHLKLKLSYNTIKLYLTGIQHHMLIIHPNNISFMASHQIKTILKGIQKTEPARPTQRLPINSHIFKALSDLLDTRPFEADTNSIIKTAMYLAFYGFLRPGEFTTTSATQTTHCLLASHLTKHGDHYILTLPHSKSSQLSPVDIPYYPTQNRWCPVGVLDAYKQHHKFLPCQPLLQLRGSALTTTTFMTYVRSSLTQLGLNASNYSGHSFRIGAASTASSANIPAHVIKKLGRWKSSAFARYIPNPTRELRNAFQNMSG
ncbi:uncharacterized protein LOC120995167 [Bufo bufo]|uniref:uncharacterized protein LOC120995167 n=1 Tax=Bufo bufo TaxID=8384 RepID=UPI001ABE9C5D|nr:uncharacterized protein LOC120995167 [Bufo bufo]